MNKTAAVDKLRDQSIEVIQGQNGFPNVLWVLPTKHFTDFEVTGYYSPLVDRDPIAIYYLNPGDTLSYRRGLVAPWSGIAMNLPVTLII